MKNRDIYMKTLLDFKDKNVIKIVTGIRRCGKSSLLELFSEKLKELGVNEQNIIKINFESMRFSEITDYKKLYAYIEKNISKNGKTYIVLDEIQVVASWEKAINSFLVDFDVDIYITGSNAYLLSSELSTFLSGRYVEIKMLPLSFAEFLDFNSFDVGATDEEKFEYYLKYGGMPAIAEFNFDTNLINNMLEGIYSTVILKDVMSRNKLSDQALLQKIVMFLADNIGNVTSPNSIGNFLSSEGDLSAKKKNPANRTVENYITMLQNSFVFYGIKRYDIKGKQYLKTLGKNYIVDTGMRNMLLGYRDVDRGHILENVVFFELLRRGYRVSIGKIYEKEIDFVAETPDDKIYIQVSESIKNPDTLERELSPLREVNDNYEKIILSADRNFVKSYDGIKVRNIIDFLLKRE